MTGRIYEWRVTNTTTARVSFDDKTLDPSRSIMVSRLTDDILAGFGQGRLLIDPDPTKLIAGLAQLVGINPCQLPLPVRIIGEQTQTVGHSLVDTPPITVPHSTRVEFLHADRRRVLWRLRNVGTQPLWLGGNSVTDANGFILVLPGQVYTEQHVPATAWYAYVPSNMTNTDGALLVQQVYTGVV
jgi:hypothetical protein